MSLKGNDLHQLDIILGSSFFDADYYKKQYFSENKDIQVEDLAQHYLDNGFTGKYNPSSVFITKDYLFLCSNLKEHELNPLVHYELFGKQNNYSTKIIEAQPQNYNLEGTEIRNSILNAIVSLEAPVRLNGVKISGGTCSIGAGSYISNSSLTGVKSIGRLCSIANNCSFIGVDHPVNAISTSAVFNVKLNWTNGYFDEVNCVQQIKKYNESANKHSERPLSLPIIVGNDVWIGYGSIILKGVTIGDGAVVGAGSVVTHDVPPYAVVAGNPAKVIKYRFSEDIIKKLLDLHWWDYGPNIMKDVDYGNIDEAIAMLRERINDNYPVYNSTRYTINLKKREITRK